MQFMPTNSLLAETLQFSNHQIKKTMISRYHDLTFGLQHFLFACHVVSWYTHGAVDVEPDS